MRYLLDSHILFWSVFETQKLPQRYVGIIESPHNTKYISVVSLWELAIKKSLGKLNMPDDFHARLEQSAVTILPLSLSHVHHVLTLPFHHRDPFDRMLIAQAQAEGLTLLTDDMQLQRYGDIITLL